MNYKAITHLLYRLLKARGDGLNRTPDDPRDFETGIFGWFDYKPKHRRHIIETLSVRNQRRMNTCAWNATTVQKEIDEKMRLSVRSLVIKGKILGYIVKNGFSNLRDNQKVLLKWGILKEGIIEELTTSEWNRYSNPKAIEGLDKEAAKHKISSYWKVSSRNDALKLLDDNRVISTGMKWYTGFNQGGGFRFPWFISKIIGLLVGGHAYSVIGYDLDYKPKKVYICQNTYSLSWGDSGKFYVDMDYLDKKNYGYYTNLDEIDNELGKFLMKYDGKNVKGKGSTVYFVQKGKIKAYPDEVTYLAFNVRDGGIKNWNFVKDSIIEKVKKGDNMQIEKSLYWDYLKNIKGNEARLNKLIQILSRPY